MLWSIAPILLLFLGAVSSATAAATGAEEVTSPARGEALFDGREPLSGTIRGHASPMPAGVLTCGGCHKQKTADATEVPALDAADLLTQKVRRNGPPSAYRLETFCRLLRTGVDPVYIVVSRTMPLFEVSPQQCDSLWSYLTQQEAPQ